MDINVKYQSKNKQIMSFQNRAKQCVESNFYMDNDPLKLLKIIVIWELSCLQWKTFHWHLIN